MKRKYELLGHKLELIGLVLALCATFWQASIGGWWDKEGPEWQYWIQEEVNIAVLNSIGDLATLESTADLIKRDKFSAQLRNKTTDAVMKAISMREERTAQKNGSGALLSYIGFILFFLSALSIIVGKFLVYRSIKIDSCNN